MQQNIIYQKEQKTKSQSFLARICSCLSFLKSKQHQTNQLKYQLGIDSPKSSFLGQRKLIVLDLDETLVHSQFQFINGYDFSIDIIVQGQLFKVYVTIRPGVYEFIEQLYEFYDIVFWTASLQEYADPVMDFIDPNNRAIGRMYRDSCTPLQIGLTKNLNKLGRDMKDIIIVDVMNKIYQKNSVVSFHLNPENGFQIKDFFFDKYNCSNYIFIFGTSANIKTLRNSFIFIVRLRTRIKFALFHMVIIGIIMYLLKLPDVRPVSSLFKQFNSTSSNVLNMRNAMTLNSQCQQNEQRKFQSLSRSLSLQKAKMMLSNQVFRTLTLSKDDDEDELDESKIRDKLGLNQPPYEKANQQPDQTEEEDKETYVISH